VEFSYKREGKMATVFVAIPGLAESPWESLVKVGVTEIEKPGTDKLEGSYIQVKLAHTGYNDIDGSIRGNQEFLLIYHSGRSARSKASNEFQSYGLEILKADRYQEYDTQPSAGYFGFFRIRSKDWKVTWDLICPETGQIRTYSVRSVGDGIDMRYTQDNFEAEE
jgi:hypothetical protein